MLNQSRPQEVNPQAIEAEEAVKSPSVQLEDIETYKDVVKGLRDNFVTLINEGVMTEATAERLMNEFMYNTFNQVVKVQYR